MLTVACVWWGDKYGAEYIERLQRGVARNLSLFHRFVCLTDRDDAPCETLPLNANHLQNNMKLMALHRPDNGLEGRVLAIDLDAVITGSLDDIAAYDGPFAVVRDFNRPKWTDGFMRSFEAGSRPDLYHGARGKREIPHFRENLGPCDYWQDMLPGQVVSYKVHCREGLPEDARIVSFHGKPNPHEVLDGWVRECWR